MFNRLTATLLASTMLAGTAWAETTVKAVMHSGLRVLDPVITTAHITRNHAYMIYDVLIAQDSQFQPQPQMADWAVSDDQLTYTFTLRDGLTFHDGAPVTAADAVASLKRWGQKDAGGQVIMDRTASLEATDDKTITWTLTEPFVPMLDMLSKQSALPPFIMPARVAETSADEAITDYTGSGPFRFNKEAWRPGALVVYDRNPDYVPRAEPPDGLAGGRVVKVDRVEWHIMPDPATAASALQTGEIDVWEQPAQDLLPMLQGARGIVVDKYTTNQAMLRPNHLFPPFNDPRARLAMAYLVNQEDALAAGVGDEKWWKTCGSYFVCGSPNGTEAGSEGYARPNVARAKQLLAEAGYPDGFPIEFLMRNEQERIDIGQALQGTMAQAGITLNLRPVVGSEALEIYRARNHELTLQTWGTDYPDPHTNASVFASNPDNSADAKLVGNLAWRNAYAAAETTPMVDIALGVVMVGLGASLAVLGAWRWRRTTRALTSGGEMPGPTQVMLVVAAIVVVAVLVAVAMVIQS